MAGAVLCVCFYGLAGARCRCVRFSAPCCAVSVVLWVSAGAALGVPIWGVRCGAVCAFFNKNKGLQCF